MKKFAKIVDKETGMCVVGLGNDSKYYLSIGLELLDVVEAPDGAWYLLEKTQGDEYKERMKIYRKSIFEKEFFKTSQGWIRRKVNMSNGEVKDFLSDLLLQIKIGLEFNQEIKIITYKTPDFSVELTDSYIQSLQEKKLVSDSLIKECLDQIAKDWNGISI